MYKKKVFKKGIEEKNYVLQTIIFVVYYILIPLNAHSMHHVL